ncbi:unnamed protein product, partial [Pylaiella littoralis]
CSTFREQTRTFVSKRGAECKDAPDKASTDNAWCDIGFDCVGILLSALRATATSSTLFTQRNTFTGNRTPVPLHLVVNEGTTSPPGRVTPAMMVHKA